MHRFMCRLTAGAIACAAALITSANAEPVEYVRVCSLYGSGFYYIPGTDTCIRLSGRPRPERDLAPVDQWGWNIQGMGYLGQVKADSFNQDYNTGAFGWSVKAGLRLPNYFRLQADAFGQDTGSYSDQARASTYWGAGGHVSWNFASNMEIGVFGGYVDANPTFSGLNSKYDFYGVEGRYFNNWLVLGGQVGRLDVSSGPGTLNDAWLAEGRVRVRLGGLYTIPDEEWDDKSKFTKVMLRTSVYASLGHASGNFAQTQLKAESTQWNVSLSYRWNWNVSSFVGYHGFENKIENQTVWTEHMWKTGILVNFGTPGSAVRLEPMLPTPTALGVLTRF